MVPNKRKLYDYSPNILRNDRTRHDVVSMFDLATCVSDNACMLPHIDSTAVIHRKPLLLFMLKSIMCMCKIFVDLPNYCHTIRLVTVPMRSFHVLYNARVY